MGTLKLRRLTTTARLLIIPAIGEPIYDLDKNLIFMGDGSTYGGLSHITETISNGDLVHSPSGNSVFDALALKANLTSPALVTPALGTPTAGLLTNCTAATADDNVSTTALATTQFAKSQDAVLNRFPDQSVTIVSGGATGIYCADDVNFNFGTSDFSLAWKGSLPDWTPASIQYMINHITIVPGDFSGFYLGYGSDSKFTLAMPNSTQTAWTYYKSAAVTFVDDTTHSIIVSITRETALVDGSISFYIDGVLSLTLAITAGSLGTVTTASPFTVSGSPTASYNTTVCFAAAYNIALTSDEVLSLYRNGISTKHQWGSTVTNIKDPDDSTMDTIGHWIGIDADVTGGYDSGDEGHSTCLRIISTAATGRGELPIAHCPVSIGRKYKVSFDYKYVVTTGFVSALFQMFGVNLVTVSSPPTTWTTYSGGVTANTTNTGIRFYVSHTGVSGIEALIDNIVLTPIGATIAWEPEGISETMWWDSSTNQLSGTYTAARYALNRKVPSIDDSALARSPNQSLSLIYTVGTGVTIPTADNLNFGTYNFSIAWKGSLPNWAPTTSQILVTKREQTGVGYALYVDHIIRGRLKLYLNSTIVYSSIPMNAQVNTRHQIVVSVIVGETDTLVNFYVDGKPLGTEQSVTNTATITSNDTVYILSNTTNRTLSTCSFFALYNRSLSDSEVLDLYRNSISGADQWGTNTPTYTSDFSAGVDGWTAAGGAAAGNIDSIGGEDNWLRFTCNTANSTHALNFLTSTPGINLKWSFKYFIPSTNSNLNSIAVGGNTYLPGSVLDTVSTISGVSKGDVHTSVIYGFANLAGTFTDAGGNDVFYIKDVVITQVGATICLESEGIQPIPGQWLDSSSNKLHALLPTATALLLKRMKTFEVRWTNTWDGTHEAQYIGGSNRSILPVGCYIDSIVGVITGSTIEDIIIGDGSDTDHWVTLTSGLAAGTITFDIANHSGTAYKLVVDPDANFTGSIAFTITGKVLQ